MEQVNEYNPLIARINAMFEGYHETRARKNQPNYLLSEGVFCFYVKPIYTRSCTATFIDGFWVTDGDEKETLTSVCFLERGDHYHYVEITTKRWLALSELTRSKLLNRAKMLMGFEVPSPS